MAFIFADSFDHYATADILSKYTQVVDLAGASIIAAIGARGSNGLKMTGSLSINQQSDQISCLPDKPLPSGDTIIFGMRVRSVNAFSTIAAQSTEANSGCLIAFRKSGATQCWVQIMPTGVVNFNRGSSATLVGGSSSPLSQNVYHYLEAKIKLHASAGTIDIWLDGGNVLSLTAQNTANGQTSWDEFRFGPFTSTGSNPTFEIHVDDFYLLDGSGSTSNARLGDVRIDALFPTAAGSNSGWTRSTGSDQSATIDETAPNSDTDYNSTGTLNAVDTVNFPDAPVVGASVYAVQLNMFCKKTDAGSAGIKAVTRIGGTEYLGTERTIASSYRYVRHLWDVKPSDSTSWVDTDFNAAEFGYKKTS